MVEDLSPATVAETEAAMQLREQAGNWSDVVVSLMRSRELLKVRAEQAERERDAIQEWAAKWSPRTEYHYGGGKIGYEFKNKWGPVSAETPEAAIRLAAGLEPTTP